jgi:hypothetical protein
MIAICILIFIWFVDLATRSYAYQVTLFSIYCRHVTYRMYHFASSFLFTIPQKLSNRTLSVPWVHRTNTCTSLSSSFWPRSNRRYTRTPSWTCAGTSFNLPAPSWPASFIFRRACRDHTFSAARPVPAEASSSQLQNQGRESNSLFKIGLAVSIDVPGAKVNA